MNVIEALAKRRSVRAFLSTPIDPKKLTAIFEAALRTPSWANSQPWEMFVATGKTLERIKKGYAENYANNVPAAPETPRPTEWPDVSIQRREQLNSDMRRDCGDTVAQFGKLNQMMFGAPAVIYPCMDKLLSQWSLYDIGAYSQSLMLAATEYGLDTIPAMTLTLFPDILRRELQIPENLKVTIGIAIGYPDVQNAINNFVSARIPVNQNLHIFD